jgi:hypothetical protein
MPLLSLLALAAFFCCSALVLPGGGDFCGVGAGSWANARRLMAAVSVRRWRNDFMGRPQMIIEDT